MVFNSYSWVAAENLQMQDRIYRLTQTRDVTCVYQLFTDSISTDMFNKVLRKEIIMNETIKSESQK
jgi:SNF2 family DNA or RNA helicase